MKQPLSFGISTQWGKLSGRCILNYYAFEQMTFFFFKYVYVRHICLYVKESYNSLTLDVSEIRKLQLFGQICQMNSGCFLSVQHRRNSQTQYTTCFRGFQFRHYGGEGLHRISSMHSYTFVRLLFLSDLAKQAKLQE